MLIHLRYCFQLIFPDYFVLLQGHFSYHTWACEQWTLTDREMEALKCSLVEKWFAEYSHSTCFNLFFALCPCSLHLVGIIVSTYQGETGRDHSDFTSYTCKACPSNCRGNATTLFSVYCILCPQLTNSQVIEYQ
jgi:hypothetical protein